MKLPNAFFASRVTEALDSLATHVVSAREIAASLKPAEVSEPTLKPDQDPRPIITSVTPGKVPLPDKRPYRGPITVKGENLTGDSIKEFNLFLETDPAVEFVGKNLAFSPGPLASFTTDVTLDRPGTYEVRIKDANGELNLPGLSIEVEPPASPPAPGPRSVTITELPWDADLKVGDRLTLSANATGNVKYQWYDKAMIPLVRETRRKLIINATLRTGDRCRAS